MNASMIVVSIVSSILSIVAYIITDKLVQRHKQKQEAEQHE